MSDHAAVLIVRDPVLLSKDDLAAVLAALRLVDLYRLADSAHATQFRLTEVKIRNAVGLELPNGEGGGL